jgi:hypothetical protein
MKIAEKTDVGMLEAVVGGFTIAFPESYILRQVSFFSAGYYQQSSVGY